MQVLRYVFYPNPGQVTYASSSMVGLLVCSGMLLLASITIRVWRRTLPSSVTKRLTRSWASASFWFAILGVVFVVARVEGIQFLAMRLLVILWWGGLLLTAFFQGRQFLARNYAVVPSVKTMDPNEKYLPKRRKR